MSPRIPLEKSFFTHFLNEVSHSVVASDKISCLRAARGVIPKFIHGLLAHTPGPTNFTPNLVAIDVLYTAGDMTVSIPSSVEGTAVTNAPACEAVILISLCLSLCVGASLTSL